MNIYQQTLMDHYRNPRNAGTLDSYDFSTGQHNPSCGDSIGMQGVIVDGVLTDIAFTGSGCVISQATASLLTQFVRGKTIQQILDMNKDDIQSLIGTNLGPMRLRCALLSLEVLQSGIRGYQQSKG